MQRSAEILQDARDVDIQLLRCFHGCRCARFIESECRLDSIVCGCEFCQLVSLLPVKTGNAIQLVDVMLQQSHTSFSSVDSTLCGVNFICHRTMQGDEQKSRFVQVPIDLLCDHNVNVLATFTMLGPVVVVTSMHGNLSRHRDRILNSIPIGQNSGVFG